MENTSRALPFKNFFRDFFTLLTADINAPLKVKELPRAEIYSGRGSYFEIVAMRRQINLFKRSRPTRVFDGLMYESKIRFPAFLGQGLTINKTKGG